MTFAKRLCAPLFLLSSTFLAAPVAAPVQAAIVPPAPSAPATNAASGVYGYGRLTVGGAGGRTIYVNNLRDSGRGSLRAALEDAKGRRVVRIRVAGTITLQSPIKIKNPYITVAAGRAPAKGIQVRGAPIVVVTHDVIIRHLRVRVGDAGLTSGEASEYDAVTINGVGKNDVYNIVLDHMSMTWGPDIGGLAILGNARRVTVQNSIMGEGLYRSRHPEGSSSKGHSTAVNITQMDPGQPAPSRITLFRNLITTSNERMPRVIGGSCVDVVNNLIYNWGIHAGAGNPRSLNLIGNWFRKGPRMVKPYIWTPTTASATPNKFANSVFTRGNFSDARHRAPDGTVYAGSVRCGGTSVRARAASTVMSIVLRSAGAKLPIRDSVDRRVIHNVRYRLGRWFNGVGYPAPNPYWPSLTN